MSTQAGRPPFRVFSAQSEHFMTLGVELNSLRFVDAGKEPLTVHLRVTNEDAGPVWNIVRRPAVA